MNILIPDSWLREFLKTNAKPEEVQKYLSLSGPSVERIHNILGEPVYDIEVTTNRVDMMSVYGIAREAAAILPHFGFQAELQKYNPRNIFSKSKFSDLDIDIVYDVNLCYRIIALKISGIEIAQSPKIIKKRLEQVGSRSLNNIVDVTNYVMWEIGHPLHVFDYDSFSTKKLIIRASKKGEKIISLENKTYTLNGGEIIFDDVTGKIIDLPGIIGTSNSVVTNNTKNILLFSENSDPVRIRKASMGLGIRTQAAVLNEKHPCSDFARLAVIKATELITGESKGKISSPLIDHGITHKSNKTVKLSKSLLTKYIGTEIDNNDVIQILSSLGFDIKTKSLSANDVVFEVTIPPWRFDDIGIGEDLIEEIARIRGYHTICPSLPSEPVPENYPESILETEYIIKMLFYNFGFTEILTYSMISKTLLQKANFEYENLYRIQNPLNEDHEYMRPNLLPGGLGVISLNQTVKKNLNIFELSNIYLPNDHILPVEKSMLLTLSLDHDYAQMKGITEVLFDKFGLKFPVTSDNGNIPDYFDIEKTLILGSYGFIGYIKTNILKEFDIASPVVAIELDIEKINRDKSSSLKYIPIPKYPALVQDFAFIVPNDFQVGKLIENIKTIDKLVESVFLIDLYKNIRTFRVSFRNPDKTLSDEEITPIRHKILKLANDKFNLILKEATDF